MCGIVGLYHFDPEHPIDADLLDRMRDALTHRGPNDQGSSIDGRIGLGMRRLSIIDIRHGRQPLANEDNSIYIVFNGEIYNHDSLRTELLAAGHRFRSACDTETILHLYEEHGTDCLRHLRGMFAFAVWDRSQRRLFVARDRLGIKPLYWTQNNKQLAFASEIKGLLEIPGVAPEIDWTAIDAFFTYGYIPSPLSAYTSIAKLPPGHYMLVNESGVTTHRYWDLEFWPKLGGSETQIANDFRDLFQDTVRMHLMSEVPLGVFLSGGMDSGLVVAMASQHSETPLRTFTVGFGGQCGDYLDERPFARKVAERYDCQHHEFEVPADIETALSIGIESFDEPFADDSLVPTHHICRLAQQHVTVVLTGLGGDENFAGYERYLGMKLSGAYARLPAPLRNYVVQPLIGLIPEMKGGHYRVNHMKRFTAGGALDASSRYQSYLAALPTARRRALYTPEVARLIDFDRVNALGMDYFSRLGEGDLLDRALYQDIMTYLPEDILALNDRIGMHHSLELRVPFVDHEVVEYCARIPSRFKIRAWTKKRLLKRIAKAYLPPEVFTHRKQGFASPMASWLNRDLQAVVNKELSVKRLDRDGVFAARVVRELIEDHAAHRSLHDKTLFALLVFQKWIGRKGMSA